jgi:hypothetical protein
MSEGEGAVSGRSLRRGSIVFSLPGPHEAVAIAIAEDRTVYWSSKGEGEGVLSDDAARIYLPFS